MNVHFDVVVVGAGPGGIAAAAVAAEAGGRVCLLDDNRSPGGQIWRGLSAQAEAKSSHARQFHTWLARLKQSNCVIWPGWQVVNSPQANVLRIERGESSPTHGESTRDVRFEHLILATGARERFLPFPGWTLPGVMGVGGLQALVKSGLDPAGKRVVLAGTGPLLLAVGASLQTAGATVLGIYEQAPLAKLAGLSAYLLRHPDKLVEGARYRLATRHAPFRTGTWVVRAEGRGRVESVTVTDGRKQWDLACDWLGSGFHLVPNLELPRLLACRIAGSYVDVDRLQQTSAAKVFCVGELTGIGGLDKAVVEGQIAALAATGRTAEALAFTPQRRRRRQFAARLDQAFALRSELRLLVQPDTLVCRCEDVSYAALQGNSTGRQARLHTRCGMGPCQGRVCGPATEFLFGWDCAGARPPIFPAAVTTMAASSPATSASKEISA